MDNDKEVRQMYYDSFKNKKLRKALIAYDEHFHTPFPTFNIGSDTVETINKCIEENKEYDPDDGLIY